MTEFETKLIEVLTDIKTELRVLTLEEHVRSYQREFNILLGRHDHFERMSEAKSAKMSAKADKFYDENPGSEADYVPDDEYLRDEKLRDKWDKERERISERLNWLIRAGCISPYGISEF